MSRRYPYRFESEADRARFHADMRKALTRVDLNRPFGVQLVPIRELDSWGRTARVRYGLAEVAR
jgi:hypothetical protein